MKQLYLALGILLQFQTYSLWAQKEQIWYYNLDPKVAKQLLQGSSLDTSMFTKAMPRSSFNSLPFYQQLILQNEEEELKIKVHAQTDFSVRAMSLGGDFAVRIIEASGKSLPSAKVAINDQPLVFHSRQNTYTKTNFLPNVGILSIDINGYTFFYELTAIQQKPVEPETVRLTALSTTALRGYIAFCKPVFRHRDSLKAKIYAAQPNGRPFKGDLRLELKSNKVWWDTLVSVDRGAFSLDLPLADSLPLDKEYTLSATPLYGDKIVEGLNHTFYLEEYQLDEVQYNLHPNQNQFQAGEKIQIQVVARTSYNTPVPEVKVQVLGSAIYNNNTYGDLFWRFSARLDEEGMLLLDIPPDRLPTKLCRLRFEASFSRPGAMVQKKEIVFWYHPVAIELKVSAKQVQAYAQGKPFQLWVEYDWGRQLLYAGNQTFAAPFNPSVKAYSAGFKKPETFLYLNNERVGDGLVDQIRWQCQNLRKDQSITMHNPLGIPIWYQIGYKNKTLQKGQTQDTLLSWQHDEKSPKDLYLQYQYWWGEKWYTKRRLIPHQQQQLQIEWIAPEQIYPGQNVDLKLSVRDEKGTPLSGVDLTAGAINAQFGEQLPHSPLALAAERTLPDEYLEYRTLPLNREWHQALNATFYKKLTELSADSYYRYRFIENGFLSERISLPDSSVFQENAFFSPFVIEQGKFKPIVMVYAQDTLVYFGGNAESTHYSFCMTPGYHRINVRTVDGLYQIDSVYLQAGYRQSIVLDAVNFKRSAAARQLSFFPLPDSLILAEKQLLAKTIIHHQGKKDHFYAWDHFGHSYSWVKRNGLDYSSDLIGPFVPGGIVQYIQPFVKQNIFEFNKDSLPSTTFRMSEVQDFNGINLWSFPAPDIFDNYEVPFSARSPRETYLKTGFNINTLSSKLQRTYCLPHGADGLIKGHIVDSEGQGLAYSSIWTKENGGADADELGHFKFQLRSLDEQIVGVSYLGHEERIFRTCLSDSTFSGEITLYKNDKTTLDVVMVKSYQTISKMERTTYSASRIITTEDSYSSNSSQERLFRLNLPRIKLGKSKNQFEESSLLYPLSNGIRSRFSDCAFWRPNLLSDPEGKAVFSVKFPDNITSWKAFAIGVDDQGEMGLGLGNINAFKPLQAQLYTPRFLVAGDQIQLNAKVTNLVSSPTLIHTYFKQGGQNLQDSNWVAPAYTKLTHEITTPTGGDSLTLEFGLQTGQYIDGEAHRLPIVPVGRMKPHGQVIEITRDTLIVLPFDPGVQSARLTLEPGGVLQLLLDDIKYLQEYSFGCNEQTSSKLIALLLEKSLRGMLGEAFAYEKDIPKGIAILEERQQEAGGWSWWENGEQRYWITNYVLKALLRASQAGYPVKALKKGLLFLQNQMSQMKEEDYLMSMETLIRAGIKTDLSRLKKEPTAITGQDLLYKKILREQLLQANNLPYSLDTLYKYQRFMVNGKGAYWSGTEVFGNPGYRLTHCNIQNTLLAYSIFKKAGKLEELKQIQRFFLDNRGFYDGNYRYGGRWTNTMEVAKILEAILPDLMEEKKHSQGKKSTKQTIAGASPHQTLALGNTPIQLNLSKADTFLIKLDPGNPNPAYLTFVQYTKAEDSTVSNNSENFEVNTQFLAQQRPREVLQQNEVVTLQVNVRVRRSAQHIMLEIPIPAGCTYVDKKEIRNPYEVHREYHVDRVVIFCDELPVSNQAFTVQLMPQFAGNFTLNPVWVEDMYHPLDNGTNTVRKVEIRQ